MSFGAMQTAKVVERNTLITGSLGAGVGVVGFTFMGEFIASALNLSGFQKLLASAATKLGLGAVALFFMGKTTGLTSLFLLAAGWGGLGSILIDLFQYLKPTGGIFAVAESAASYVRGEADVTARVEEAIRIKRAGLGRLASQSSSSRATQSGRTVTVVSE